MLAYSCIHCTMQKTYRSGVRDVLGRDNSLYLNDEEVDQLLDITQDTLDGILGDCPVTARTDGAHDTFRPGDLCNDLSAGDDCMPKSVFAQRLCMV